MSNENLPSLGNNSADYAATISRIGFGAVPYVGSIMAEVVGNVIPNQRLDRIVKYLEILGGKLAQIEQQILRERLQSTNAIDLFEDGLFLASRARSTERKEWIASVVAQGIPQGDDGRQDAKRMLWLLDQLNDEEIILLRSKLAITRDDILEDHEFREHYVSLLTPDTTHMQSREDELEQEAIRRSYRQRLVDLGLLRDRFKAPKKGMLPEFDDKTGMMKTSGTEITRLGRMLLRHLELIPSWFIEK